MREQRIYAQRVQIQEEKKRFYADQRMQQQLAEKALNENLNDTQDTIVMDEVNQIQ